MEVRGRAKRGRHSPRRRKGCRGFASTRSSRQPPSQGLQPLTRGHQGTGQFNGPERGRLSSKSSQRRIFEGRRSFGRCHKRYSNLPSCARITRTEEALKYPSVSCYCSASGAVSLTSLELFRLVCIPPNGFHPSLPPSLSPSFLPPGAWWILLWMPSIVSGFCGSRAKLHEVVTICKSVY